MPPRPQDYRVGRWIAIVGIVASAMLATSSIVVGLLTRSTSVVAAGLEAIAALPQRDRVEKHYLLHAVTGELHWRMKNHRAAAESFRRALQLAHVGPEQLYLTRMLDRSLDEKPNAA